MPMICHLLLPIPIVFSPKEQSAKRVQNDSNSYKKKILSTYNAYDGCWISPIKIINCNSVNFFYNKQLSFFLYCLIRKKNDLTLILVITCGTLQRIARLALKLLIKAQQRTYHFVQTVTIALLLINPKSKLLIQFVEVRTLTLYCQIYTNNYTIFTKKNDENLDDRRFPTD